MKKIIILTLLLSVAVIGIYSKKIKHLSRQVTQAQAKAENEKKQRDQLQERLKKRETALTNKRRQKHKLQHNHAELNRKHADLERKNQRIVRENQIESETVRKELEDSKKEKAALEKKLKFQTEFYENKTKEFWEKNWSHVKQIERLQAIEELFNLFVEEIPENKELCRSIYDQATQYWDARKYDKASEFYQFATQKSSDSDLLMKSRAGVVRYHAISCNHSAADQEFEKLWAEHRTAKDFADQVLSICKLYMYKARDEDPKMALQYIDRLLQAFPDHEKTLLFLKTKAVCYVLMDKSEPADAVIDKIVQNYLSDKDLPEILNAIANCYRRHDYHERSIEVYQQVVDKSSDKTQLVIAHGGIAKNSLRLGNEEKVAETVSTMCTDFAGHENLSWEIYHIAVDYFYTKNY